MPRFSANLTLMFNEVPFLDRFAAAARAGFRAVEFMFPYEFDADAIKDRLDAHRLQLVLFNMPAGTWSAGDRGLACDPSRIEEFQASVGLALDYARALGVTRLHCMAGLRPPNVPDPVVHETYVSNLRFAGHALAAENRTLLIEAVNTRDFPGFFLNRSAQAFEIMAETGLANLLFQFDCYHLQVTEGDLTPTLTAHLSRIGHIQIADTPGRHEPGTGEIHYPFIFDTLDRIGYRGWVGCEYRPTGRTEDGLGWLAPYLERDSRSTLIPAS